MSEKIDINHVHSVCDSCAESLGWTRQDKAVGVWMGTCGICGERRPLTSLWHDWDPPKKNAKPKRPRRNRNRCLHHFVSGFDGHHACGMWMNIDGWRVHMTGECKGVCRDYKEGGKVK